MTAYLIAHPFLAAFIAALFANLFVAGVIVGMTKGRILAARWSQVWTWGLRTFTRAGDHSTCANCAAWELPVKCMQCGRVHRLTPTSEMVEAAVSVAAELVPPSDDQIRRSKAIAGFEYDALVVPYRRPRSIEVN